MQELIKALIKAKSEFKPIRKDRTNPDFKRKYATLDSVLEAVTPALNKYGLAVIQTTAIIEGKPCLQTHLYHESGESISSPYPLPEISDPQKLGAAITYARRYALCAILSVTAEDDDDGNTAAGAAEKKQASAPSAHPRDIRIKNIRLLLNYPVDLIKDFLAGERAEFPRYLKDKTLDKLVQRMCLAWAADKLDDPRQALDSYNNNVSTLVLNGGDEIESIKMWMRLLQSPSAAVFLQDNFEKAKQKNLASLNNDVTNSIKDYDYDDAEREDWHPGHPSNYGDR